MSTDREMKCSYKNCKLGGKVLKSEAIKDKSYFHKECYQIKQDKARIRELYYEKFKSKETAVKVNSAISKFIDSDGFDSGYVLWCLKLPSVKLNSLYGLSNALGYKKNEDEWRQWKASQVELDWNKVEIIERKDSMDKKQPQKIRLWGDLFN